MKRVKFMCRQCSRISSKPQGTERRECYSCVPKTSAELLMEQFGGAIPQGTFKNDALANLKLN
jgi:hypothetical protein